MNINIVSSCEKVIWADVFNLLKTSGIGTYTIKLHELAFINSYRVVFVYNGDSLVGCGRLLSDGVYQGAIYDVAVDENYRGNGLGKLIIETLLAKMEHINVLLYASPGKEQFYKNIVLV